MSPSIPQRFIVGTMDIMEMPEVDTLMHILQVVIGLSQLLLGVHLQQEHGMIKP